MIRTYKFDAITTTGVDGSASGSAASQHPITGKVLAVHIGYSAGQNAGTDVVIATAGSPSMPILTRSDSAAAGWFFPRAGACSIIAAALTYDGTQPVQDYIPVSDYLAVNVDGGDDGETVDVTLIYED